MSHATYTQGNQVNYRLSVVDSQIANLTLAFLLTITCVANVQMGHASPFRESTDTPTPNNGGSFGSVNVHSHTLSHSLASFLARALASPCLYRELKARVATKRLYLETMATTSNSILTTIALTTTSSTTTSIINNNHAKVSLFICLNV
jgi:hypothetical protein